MKQYLTHVRQLVLEFIRINFENVPREQNTKADMLSKLSAREPIKGTCMESLSVKSINTDICMAEVVKDWTIPIREYILNEKLPDDQKHA